MILGCRLGLLHDGLKPMLSGLEGMFLVATSQNRETCQMKPGLQHIAHSGECKCAKAITMPPFVQNDGPSGISRCLLNGSAFCWKTSNKSSTRNFVQIMKKVGVAGISLRKMPMYLRGNAGQEMLPVRAIACLGQAPRIFAAAG